MRRCVLLLVLLAVLPGCLSSRRRSAVPELPDGEATALWRGRSARPEDRAALAEARRLAGAGRDAESAERLRELLERSPDYVEAHRALQDVLLGTTADWWLRRRYAVPDAGATANQLYLSARIAPGWDEQAALFEAALKEDPAHPFARVGRALGLERRGEFEDAVLEAQRAARSAPWLPLPWLFLGHVMAAHGEMEVAERFYEEARTRAPENPRTWLGLAATRRHLGRPADASDAALEALRRAPGDDGIARGTVDALLRSLIPEHIDAALLVAGEAIAEAGDPAVVHFARGRLLLGAGRNADAVTALEDAALAGYAPAEVAVPLRRARVRSGLFRAAVEGSLAVLPEEALAPDNLYAPRWRRLRSAAQSVEPGDGDRLLELADAMTAVGWLDEARIVLTAAAAAAPDDPDIARRSHREMVFGLFLSDLERLAREVSVAARRGETNPDFDTVLERIDGAAVHRLGHRVTEGVAVRSYPLLGSFALSVASQGRFEEEFGSRGLLLLVGQRSGEPAEVALGRLVLVRSDAEAVVLGEQLTFDECWVESHGLPSHLAGLRPGLAGVTLDRFVLIQLDAVRRRPRPFDTRLPFERRPAVDGAERLALDTPSLVSARIEHQLAAEGPLDSWMLDAVRQHELVHVYDARRLLPIHLHPLAGLGFLLRTGFEARGAERLLEARAAALSIAASEEPRAALAAALGFLPDLDGGSAHPSAYAGVVREMLDAIEEHPERFPSIDPAYNLVQQLDRLSRDEVRLLGEMLQDRY